MKAFSFLVLWLGYVPIVAQNAPVIERVQVNDSLRPVAAQVSLRALDDNLVITLQKIPQTADYQYFLAQYETHWQHSDYPVIRYTNLSGGNYTLHLRTCIGGKCSAETRLPIIVESSLWEEGWFIPSLVSYALLLLGAGIYFFVLYNFRQKLKVETIRNRIASDLHDEVGATLSSIAIATKVIQKKLGKEAHDLSPILAQIKSDSEESVQSIRDTVWAINPHNDSAAQVFEKMRSFALQILMAQGIAVDFNNLFPSHKPLKMSMEQRRNVYLMYKEAINNIAKHAQASHVNIDITESTEGFRLVINDNGQGFDYQETYEGNGLKNFKKRAEESFIDFKMHSEKGKGTRVEITVLEF